MQLRRATGKLIMLQRLVSNGGLTGATGEMIVMTSRAMLITVVRLRARNEQVRRVASLM